MERESFDNLEIAKMLNDDFISIKVDREERPDVDKVYVRVSTLNTTFSPITNESNANSAGLQHKYDTTYHIAANYMTNKTETWPVVKHPS